MRIQVSGHSVRRGYSIERVYSDDEIVEIIKLLDETEKSENDHPLDDIVKFIESRQRAFALVDRYNRRFATH